MVNVEATLPLSDTPTMRPARPKLVIVTPAFNESVIIERYAETIKQTLLSQPDLDVRVIIVGRRQR